MGCKILKLVSFQGRFFIGRVGLSTVSQCTKIEVMENATVRWSAYGFPFDFNRNYVSIFYRFRDIAGYLSKVADFDSPHVHLVLL